MMIEYEFTGRPVGDTAREAYKTLRTNLRFCNWEGSLRTITVSSSLPGEGKSRTALNLAISMAESGQKVLLIDADMRKTKKNDEKTENIQGLSYLLTNAGSVEDAIYSTNYESLYYLPSGCLPPNPAELVSSERFLELLSTLIEKSNFNKVIIDTPSIGGFIDGAAIAAQTDGLLLVVKCGSTNAKALKRTKEQLDKLNVRILGVVLNMMKKSEYKQFSTFEKYHRYYAKR